MTTICELNTVVEAFFVAKFGNYEYFAIFATDNNMMCYGG